MKRMTQSTFDYTLSCVPEPEESRVGDCARLQQTACWTSGVDQAGATSWRGPAVSAGERSPALSSPPNAQATTTSTNGYRTDARPARRRRTAGSSWCRPPHRGQQVSRQPKPEQRSLERDCSVVQGC